MPYETRPIHPFRAHRSRYPTGSLQKCNPSSVQDAGALPPAESSTAQHESLKIIFSVSHATVSNWLTAWETKGIVGLRNQPGQGRKPTLVAADLPLIKVKVQQNPQDIKAVRDALKVELGREFSAKTLKTFLKSLVGHPGDGAVPRRDVNA